MLSKRVDTITISFNLRHNKYFKNFQPKTLILLSCFNTLTFLLLSFHSLNPMYFFLEFFSFLVSCIVNLGLFFLIMKVSGFHLFPFRLHFLLVKHFQSLHQLGNLKSRPREIVVDPILIRYSYNFPKDMLIYSNVQTQMWSDRKYSRKQLTPIKKRIK